MTIFIVWADYDGPRIEQFESTKSAENRLNAIVDMQTREYNGTQLLKVIEGRELKYTPVEVITKVKLQSF